MAEPPSQLRTRGYILKPRIEGQVCLLHPARPQALDQKANTVVILRKIIDTLKANHSRSFFHVLGSLEFVPWGESDEPASPPLALAA
jgi:hypothetical protein